MARRVVFGMRVAMIVCAALGLAVALGAPTPFGAPRAAAEVTQGADAGAPATNPSSGDPGSGGHSAEGHGKIAVDYWPLLFVFALATFIGLGVIVRVSRLLHTPLMSLTNAISAIAVVGSIMVAGADYPTEIRVLGTVALFASMTNIVSGFLITDRMLKMFKEPGTGGKR
jgi:NAD(P) transhydrogenase subunit alpha